ncbi:MAG TPA: hypothetical protein VMP67_05055 [Candidatus Limnocylindria bacterium]|nr:hypothetical protein [Candidatus Limnocylindria bacterium]
MTAVLRFLVFAALLVALLVFVVVPVVASPLLTQMVRDMGFQADELEVTIDSFDPALFGGRASRLRVQSGSVALSPATVEQLDLTFQDVSFFERTFENVRGELRGVVVTAGGVTVRVSSVQVDGPARAAQASGNFTAQESEQLVRLAAERAGIRLDSVRFVDGGLRVGVAGVETGARIEVSSGALVLMSDFGPAVVLLQPAPSDPWRLSEAYVASTGVTVIGLVDAARLTAALPAP